MLNLLLVVDIVFNRFHIFATNYV